jgi:flagellar motor switch protein FliM
VIVISFDVHVSGHTFLMNLCFPTFALEEVLAKLNRQQVTTSAHPQSEKKIRENIVAVNQQISITYLPVIAELCKTSINVTELLDLKVGDVMKTKKRIDQEIEIIIAGKRKLAARPGVVDGKKAVRIIRPLTADDLYEEDLSYKKDKV